MNNTLNVKEESTLYEYLRANLKYSKNTIKGFLTKKMVTVNGKTITKYDYPLHKGDTIVIGNTFIEAYKKEIDIIYEDRDIVVVNKPSGLLTIATEKEKERTLYSIVSNYVKEEDRRNKIFIVHRLDKDTSGVVVFAKNEKIKNELQSNWNENVKRKYVAIVHGNTKDEDTIKLSLKESNSGNTYVANGGDLAITKYKKIASDDNYSYVDIEILTGKKNQIRVSFAHINCPLLGDKKYGVKDDARRLMLHAYKLELTNPINKKKMEFLADTPKEFKYYKKNMK